MMGRQSGWLGSAMVLIVLSASAVAATQGDRPATRPAADFSETWLLHLPGISGARSLDRRMIQGLKDGGWAGPISIYDWTANDPGIDALLSYKRNRDQAAKVERQIEEKLRKDPKLRITVTCHSGGTGIAVWALEALPQGMEVQTLVLLASALSPDYDLSRALKHVRGKAYVYYSKNDQIVLGAGTRLFGTIDGIKTDAAGLVGFKKPDQADDKAYEKLVQKPYDDGWIAFQNIGNHVGCMSRPFAENVLAPMLIQEEVEAEQGAAATRK